MPRESKEEARNREWSERRFDEAAQAARTKVKEILGGWDDETKGLWEKIERLVFGNRNHRKYVYVTRMSENLVADINATDTREALVEALRRAAASDDAWED